MASPRSAQRKPLMISVHSVCSVVSKSLAHSFSHSFNICAHVRLIFLRTILCSCICRTKMTEAKRPLKVFLYHAPGDRNKARDLYLRLINDGVDAWLIKEKLLPGQDWKHEIQKAVHEADAVIVCLSRRFDQGSSRQK